MPIADTVSGEPKLRHAFTGTSSQDMHFRNLVSTNEFYDKLSIAPGTEYSEEFSKVIEGINDGVFVVHFYILYSNGLSNLYDTYYWARYSIKPSGGEVVDGKAMIDKKSILSSIKAIDTHTDFYMYSKKEAKHAAKMKDKWF